MADMRDEATRLCRMVDRFAISMKTKLLAKLDKGYDGWDAEDAIEADYLIDRLEKNTKENDWVDVANLACIFWRRENE